MFELPSYALHVKQLALQQTLECYLNTLTSDAIEMPKSKIATFKDLTLELIKGLKSRIPAEEVSNAFNDFQLICYLESMAFVTPENYLILQNTILRVSKIWDKWISSLQTCTADADFPTRLIWGLTVNQAEWICDTSHNFIPQHRQMPAISESPASTIQIFLTKRVME